MQVGMLLGNDNVSAAVFDTVALHCDKALTFALAK